MECSTCGKTFTQETNYYRHVRAHAQEKKFSCSKCEKSFARKDAAQRHEKNCKRSVQSSGSGIPAKRARRSSNFAVKKIKTAFRNATVTWQLKYPTNNGSMEMIDPSVHAMEYQLYQYREDERALKFNMSLHIVFEQATDSSVVTEPAVVLVSEQFEVYADTSIDEALQEVSKQLKNRIESYEGVGSGWVVSHLEALDTTVWKLDPLRASTYHPLASWIRNTKCVVNIKNKDQKCFKYAVLAGLYEPSSKKKPDRLSSYAYTEALEDVPEFSMLEFPVSLRNIKKFEKANDISVNVYGVEEFGKFYFYFFHLFYPSLFNLN